MVVILRYHFEKLINKAWTMVAYYTGMWLVSGQTFLDLPLEWSMSFSVILLTYFFFCVATLKLKVLDHEQIVSYWGLLGFKFGMHRIQRSEIKDLAIIQLPNNYYALVLRLKNQPDFVLYSALNKRLLSKKLIVFKNDLSHLPFFRNFSVDFHAYRMEVDKV